MGSRTVTGMVLVFWCVSASVLGQVSIGGQPLTFVDQSLSASIPVKLMPSVDNRALLAEDEAEQSKDVPLRFGYPFDVNFTTDNAGFWQILPNGDRLWRLRIASPSAFSINLLYDRFWLPEGAKLFLYSEDQSFLIGAFTSQNNKAEGQFATAPVKGDVCVLEYYEPASASQRGVISISRVIHAYRNLFDRHALKGVLDYGDAGACNVNVNCPEGADWQDIKRGVAMILTGGGGRLCSGTMINNVRQDLTPYFLTANHCLGGETSWIFMFNYESPGCTNVDGPTWMTVQGSTLRASNSFSDFGLVQLTEQPPDSYNVYFVGWNAVDSAVDTLTDIHHPQGDIKKISFEYDAIASTGYLGAPGSGDSHWRVADWDVGTTEPGSSGSPLLDDHKRIMGQLHGGYAACGNNDADWFGKFAKSWNYGTTASTRLRDWLDPDNTGALTLDGRPAAGISITHTPLQDTQDTLNPYEVICVIKSNTPVVADSLVLHYNVGAGYVTALLTTTGVTDEYHAFIPQQSPGTDVSYFMTAANTNGDADTTQVYTFRVVDYAVKLTPASLTHTGAVGDTAWFDLKVKNAGIYTDDYALANSGNIWTTIIFDATGTNVISSTGTMLPNDSLALKVAVVIPPSLYGDKDSTILTATSTASPAIKAASSLVTISAGQPLNIPFFDDFPTTSINIGKWVLASGCQVNTTGSNPPTPPYSVDFNGDAVGADTLMSQAIDLEGLSDIALTYSYEQTGGGESPDAGDDLFVEYLDNTGTWVLINQHLGADPDMTTFQEVLTYLPAPAYHAGFRVRFRNTATAGLFDDWFVDDVKVDVNFPPQISVSPLSYSETIQKGDSVTRTLTIDNLGLGSLQFAASVQLIAKRNDLLESLRAAGLLEPAQRTYPEEYQNYVEQKGADDPRVGFPVTKGAGGPDAFGYYWIDSDQPGGPTFSWTDISATGIDVVNDLVDDTVSGPYQLGFAFSFYGNTYTQFYIGSNGLIGFNSDNMRSLTNATIPTVATPNDFIAWMWDDLNPKDPTNPGAHVYIDTSGGQCVIQFTQYPEYSAAAGDVITAQVVLQQDGSILIKYLSIAPGFDLTSSTIGTENATGTDGLQVTFNSTYGHNNLLLKIYAPYRWLDVEPASGLVLSMQQKQLNVKFRTAELDSGMHTANVIISNNDPGNSPVTVPVQLHVTLAPQYVCGDVDNNGVGPDIGDLTYLVGFLFLGEAAPPIPQAADVNSDSVIDISDLTVLVEFLFMGGLPPVCP
ncbi:MAG: hypothetical protein AB1644_08720 [Candidatus Zixiibacteriota bacterium]